MIEIDPAQTDAELIAAVGKRNERAYGELWKRHHRAGLKAARSFQHLGDPEDLVAEAFARIYKTLLAGKGPTDVFRPYLYVTIRNIALSNIRQLSHLTDGPELNDIPDPRFEAATLDWELDASLTTRAFRALPTRWQEALWYSEVELLSPTETGRLMGLNANAVSALTFRAREALRSAWLQAHIDDSLAEGDHRDTLAKVGEYARGALSARDTKKVEAHLRTCTQCSLVSEEVNHVAGRLAVVLLPLFLGTAAATAFLNATPAGASAAPLASAHHGVKLFSGAGAGVAGGAVLLVVAGAAVGFQLHQQSLVYPASSKSQHSVGSPAQTTPAPSVSPSSEAPVPTAEPVAPAVPRTPLVASPATITPALPVDLTAPDVPVVTGTVDAAAARPSLSGTAEPNSTVTVLDSAGKVLATVLADGTGAWSAGTLATLSALETELRVTATDAAGNVSQPATVGPFTLYPLLMYTTTSQLTIGQEVLPYTLRGWPGESVTLRLDHADVGTYTFDTNGELLAVVVGDATNPPTGNHTLVAVYTENGVEAPNHNWTLFFTIP